MELKLCVPSVLLCLLSTKEIGTIYLVGITYIVEIRISNLALSLLDDDDLNFFNSWKLGKLPKVLRSQMTSRHTDARRRCVPLISCIFKKIDRDIQLATTTISKYVKVC